MLSELEKLDENLGGVADMKRQPDAIFIVDLRKEQLAVREARRLGLPVIALVDTNCDPDEADYVVPGNDDAIRSCDLIVRVIADGIEAGQQKATPADFERPANEKKETVPEGDYEQVSPGEEPVAEAATERGAAGGVGRMTEISAALVKELRDKTGAPMMDIKRALQDTDGDIEAAKRSCVSAGWRAPRSARAGRRPRARSATAFRRTASGDDGRRRLRDRACIEQRRVPRIREEGARGRRGEGIEAAAKLDEERMELSGKLGENIVVVGAARFEAGRWRADRGLRAPAGEQARRARAGPRRLGRARAQGRDAHRRLSPAVDRARGRPRGGSSTASARSSGDRTRCSRSPSRHGRRSSRACSTSASSVTTCSSTRSGSTTPPRRSATLSRTRAPRCSSSNGSPSPDDGRPEEAVAERERSGRSSAASC